MSDTATQDPPAAAADPTPDITAAATDSLAIDPAAPPPADPTPAAATDFSSILNPDGTFAADFHTQLPEDVQSVARGSTDLASVFSRLRENQAAARQKLEGHVKLPGKDATPEDLAAYHKAIGVPETPDDYGLKAPDDLPEGVEWNDTFAGEFAQLAHEKGLLPEQVAAIAELYSQHETARHTDYEAQAEALQAEKKAKLEEAFGDRTPDVIARARQVAQTIGLDVSDGDLFATTENIAALNTFAERFGEDNLVPADRIDARAASMDKLTSITTNRKDPMHELYLQGDPGVRALVKKLEAEIPTEMIEQRTGITIGTSGFDG
jgi:hypothetical protein